MADILWTIPLLREAWESREEVSSIYDKILSILNIKKSSLAITGLPGIGKTVLFDHLTGKAFARNYRVPGTSIGKEESKISARRKRIIITTIPGQNSPVRLAISDKLFDNKKPVEGVIHVVGYGYTTLRDPVAKSISIENGIDSLDAFQKQGLERELEDLKATLSLFKQPLRTKHKPKWMLIVVTKSDLFYDKIDEVKRYYSPLGDSPFVQILKEFTSQVGTDNFRWDTVPVCTWPVEFEWNGEKIKPQIGIEDRALYVLQLAKAIEAQCGN